MFSKNIRNRLLYYNIERNYVYALAFSLSILHIPPILQIFFKNSKVYDLYSQQSVKKYKT